MGFAHLQDLEDRVTATSGKQVDVTVQTVQWGQGYEGVTGEAVLSDRDGVLLDLKIDGAHTQMSMTPDEADNLARILQETAARVRKVVRRPDDYPAYRFIKSAFRIGGHQ